MKLSKPKWGKKLWIQLQAIVIWCLSHRGSMPSHVAAVGPHLASVLWPDNAGAPLQLLPWELSSGMNPEWGANVHLCFFSEMPQVFWPWNTKIAIVTLAQWWFQLTIIFSVCLDLGTAVASSSHLSTCNYPGISVMSMGIIQLYLQYSFPRLVCEGMVGDRLPIAWPCAQTQSWQNPAAVRAVLIRTESASFPRKVEVQMYGVWHPVFLAHLLACHKAGI